MGPNTSWGFGGSFGGAMFRPLSRPASTLRSARLLLRKQLGQHLLVNPDVVASIVRHAAIAPGERVFEIGPGTGNLTAHLLSSPAAAVYAVELDARMHAVLAPRMAALPGGVGSKLQCAWGDFLRVPLPAFDVLVANIPYQISSPVLRRLFAHTPLPSRAVIMFQKEFAERMVAKPGGAQYCRLSVNTQLLAEARIVMRIAASQFRPPPKVDSAVVRLVPRGWPQGLDFGDWDALLRACFGSKNKTLRSLLGSKTLLAGLARRRVGGGEGGGGSSGSSEMVHTADGSATREELAIVRRDVLDVLQQLEAEQWRANAMPLEAFKGLYEGLRGAGFRFHTSDAGSAKGAVGVTDAFFSATEGGESGAGGAEEEEVEEDVPEVDPKKGDGEGSIPIWNPPWRGAYTAPSSPMTPGGRRERGLLREGRDAAALAGWFQPKAETGASGGAEHQRDGFAAGGGQRREGGGAAAKKENSQAKGGGGGADGGGPVTHAEAMKAHREARRKELRDGWNGAAAL